MIAGSLIAFCWQYLELAETTSMAPMLMGIVTSSLTMVVVSLATQKASPVPAHIVEAMGEADAIGPIPKRLLAATDFSLTPTAVEVDKMIARKESDE